MKTSHAQQQAPRYSLGLRQDILALAFMDVVILLPLFILFPLLIFPQQMTVTEEEINVIQENKPQAWIAWNEMKLFAIAPIGHTGDEPLYYELSSPKKIIRLLRLRRRMRWFLFPWDVDRAVKPTTTFAVYDTQMDALLALIFAKTGLPLYDLRAI